MLLVVGCYAAKQETSKVADVIATSHEDVKAAVATIHDDSKGIITTVYGDGKDLISTVYQDSKDIAANLYPEVKSAIIAIAKALGVAAEHLYTVLVKKYVVDGLVQAIPFIVGLVLLIIGWVKTEKFVKTHEQIRWQILYPIILACAGITCLCCVDYNTMFMGLINPEFGAINYILDFTKEMIK